MRRCICLPCSCPCSFAQEGSLRKVLDRKKWRRDTSIRTDSTNGLVEHVLQALLRQSGTLQVLDGSDVLRHANALRVLDRSHTTGEIVLDIGPRSLSGDILTGLGASRWCWDLHGDRAWYRRARLKFEVRGAIFRGTTVDDG